MFILITIFVIPSINSMVLYVGFVKINHNIITSFLINLQFSYGSNMPKQVIFMRRNRLQISSCKFASTCKLFKKEDKNSVNKNSAKFTV